VVTLLDADENIVGTASPIDLFPIIEPGQTTPLQVVVNDVEQGTWVSEEVQVFGLDSNDATCSTGLELRDIKETERSFNRLRIEGKVFNGGSIPADGVSIRAAIYRTDGVYAGMISDSIRSAIPPGKTAQFSMFGLPSGMPGLLVPGVDPSYTYRLLVTNTTRGTTFC
jgi:hypothetical protein